MPNVTRGSIEIMKNRLNAITKRLNLEIEVDRFIKEEVDQIMELLP